jgi:hypothetical protein
VSGDLNPFRRFRSLHLAGCFCSGEAAAWAAHKGEERERGTEHRETFPEHRETFPEHRETFPEHRETFPEHRETFPQGEGAKLPLLGRGSGGGHRKIRSSHLVIKK